MPLLGASSLGRQRARQLVSKTQSRSCAPGRNTFSVRIAGPHAPVRGVVTS